MAVAIQDDFLEEQPVTQPISLELTAEDVRAFKSTLQVLDVPSVAHPAAAVAALLRYLASRENTALTIDLAIDWLRQAAKDGVRAARVNLGMDADVGPQLSGVLDMGMAK
jgi:hypothetical protein